MIDRGKNAEFPLHIRQCVRLTPGTQDTAICTKQFPRHHCEDTLTPQRHNLQVRIPARSTPMRVVLLHDVLKVFAYLCLLAKALDAPIRIPCKVRGEVTLRDEVTVKRGKGSHKSVKERRSLTDEFYRFIRVAVV